MIRLFSSLLTLSCATLLSGCAAIELKASKLDWSTNGATAKSTLRCSRDIIFDSLDGDKRKKIDPYSGIAFRGCDIAIDPGPHTLEVTHFNYTTGGSMSYSREGIILQFVAVPGHTYIATHTIEYTRGILYEFKYSVVDIGPVQ